MGHSRFFTLVMIWWVVAGTPLLLAMQVTSVQGAVATPYAGTGRGSVYPTNSPAHRGLSTSHVPTRRIHTASMPAQPSSCPSGWNCDDVGGAAPQGSDSLSGSTYTVAGGGSGFPGPPNSDQFNFLWQPLSGSGTLGARLVTYTNDGPGTATGLMMRANGGNQDGQAPFFAVMGWAYNNTNVWVRVSYRRYEDGPVQVASSTGPYSLPVSLQITRSGVWYTASVNSGSGWTTLLSFAVNMPGSVEEGIAATSGTSSWLNTATLDTVALTAGDPTPVTACPSDWGCTEVNQDTNPPAPSPAPGGESTNGQAWVINGPGWGFAGAWGDGSDQFRYVYRPFSGGTFSAHLTQHMQAGAPWDDAGLMIRQSTSGKAPYYMVAVETDTGGGYGIRVWFRSKQGGGTDMRNTGIGGLTSTPYLSITDSGGSFSASYSLDGQTWQQLSNSAVQPDPQTPWNGAGYAGMAVTGGQMETAAFDGVKLPPAGVTSPSNASTLGDDGGAIGTIGTVMSTTSSCGCPVNTATGNFWHSFGDLAVPGRGIALHVGHTYNALLAAQDSPLGFGWTDTYNLFLTTDADGNITVHQETGSSVTFGYTGSAYQAPSWVFATLVKNGDGTFTFTRLHGQDRFTFAAPTQSVPGVLQKEVDRNGYTTTLSYTNGNLASVTDPVGRSLTFSYGDTRTANLNHITAISTSVASPSPITVAFAYDAAGNLTSSSVTDTATNTTRTTSFTYDPNHLLLTMTDPRGTVVSNTYDGFWRVTQQVVDPGASPHLNRTTTFAYALTADGSHTTTVTLPRGNQRQYIYRTNELVSLTRGYGSSQAATWTYTYDPATLGLVSIKDPNQNTWTATYDRSGNRLSSVDPLNWKTTYTYNATNDLLSVTDPIGNAGQAPCQTAANCTVSFQYDGNGNPTCVTSVLVNPDTTTQTLTESLFYTDGHAGDLTAVTDPRGTGGACLTTPPASFTTAYAYDAYGNLTGVTDPVGDITTAGYDSLGRPTSVVEPPGNATGGTPSQYTDTLAYDAFGELTSSRDVLGHQTSYFYDSDGNVLTVTNALGKQTQYTYDAANEPTRVTQPDTNISRYTGYDANGNVISQQDGVDVANSTSVSYGYDAQDRVTSMTDRTRPQATYAYDGAGRLTSMTSPLGQITTFGYDAANELTCISTGTCTSPTIAYAYTPDGQRQSMSDSTGTTSYTYDSLGRLTGSTTSAGTEKYGYDLAGNLTQLTYPGASNLQVTRTYDAANRLTSVSDGLSPAHVTSFGYNANDLLTHISYPNTTTADFTYTNAQPDQLTQITDSKAGSPLWTFNYGRDALGQVSSSSDSLDPASHAYSYDALTRFTQDTQTSGGSTTSSPVYSYDAADELKSITDSLTSTTSTFTYDTTHQLTQLVKTVNSQTQQNLTLSYNSNGDRTSQSDSVGGTSATYGYNPFDQLTSYQKGGGSQYTYAYNGDGLRMSKTVNSSTESYLWDVAEGMPLLIQDGTTRYITGPDGLPIEQVDGSGNVLYYYQDQLGSTRGLLDGSGNTAATFTYDAYGNLKSSSGSATTPFGYAGQYTDTESGLQYLRARYYDPATSQFLTADPLTSLTGQPFAYAADNPVNASDPRGLCTAGGIPLPFGGSGPCSDDVGAVAYNAVSWVANSAAEPAYSTASNCDTQYYAQQAQAQGTGSEADTYVAVALTLAPGGAAEQGGAEGVTVLYAKGAGLVFPEDPGNFLPDVPPTPIKAGYRWRPNSDTEIEYHRPNVHQSEPGKPGHYHVKTYRGTDPVTGRRIMARVRKPDGSPEFFPGDVFP